MKPEQCVWLPHKELIAHHVARQDMHCCPRARSLAPVCSQTPTEHDVTTELQGNPSANVYK